ncbi:hypothetical protein [Nocardia sp. NPDC049526]|uniref:hypothetical protein n=1 Tax=Nocardia sp. NPDC049526 TaxID=3364316 RepID=UPI0037967D72
MSERKVDTTAVAGHDGAERQRGAGMSERSERTIDTAAKAVMTEPSASEAQA